MPIFLDSSAKKKISIVTPCYNEEESIVECYKTVKNVIVPLLSTYDFEHIFCDNASTDNTFIILSNIATQDKSVKIIRNSRNFGVLRNAYNGAMRSTGDAVLLFLPVDLQDPPQLIPSFIKYWEQGYEIVYGTRDEREEFFILSWLRFTYYRFLTMISSVDYPLNAGDFQLVDRKVLSIIFSTYTADPFLRLSTFYCGFSSIGISYKWLKRKHGHSRNPFSNLIIQALDGIISFSSLPIRLVGFLGLIVVLISFILSLLLPFLIYVRILPSAQQGILLIIVLTLLLNGITVLSLSILGEYIARILNQVRNRPVVIERESINF